MNNLYNSLLSPIIEFNEKGEQISHPPTAVMLRAGRVLKQLADTNDNNVMIIGQLQLRNAQLEAEVDQLRKELLDAQKDSNNAKSSDPVKPVEQASATDATPETVDMFDGEHLSRSEGGESGGDGSSSESNT